VSAVPLLDRSAVDGTVFAVGVVALVLAVAVALGGPATAPLVAALSPVFGPGWVALGGLLAGGLAVYTAYERSATNPHETETAVDVPRPPSRRDRETVRTDGGRVDVLIEEIQADDLDDDVSQVDASINRKRVRDRLRRAAVDAVQEAEDCGPEEAGRMLATGEWTDRPRARAFLGDDVPRLPLSVRLRDWASGERFERRASATVEEIATLSGVDYGESIAPPPVGDEYDGDRSPVDWPPEPESPGTDDTLDRLLEQPVETASDTGSGSDPEPEPAPARADPDPGPEVFRREVIPGDAPSVTAASTGSTTADDHGTESESEWVTVPESADRPGGDDE